MQKSGIKNFKEFYLEHHQAILHFAMTYLPMHEAQDVIQDCFLQVYEHWDQYESLTHVRYSLYIYVRNACISTLRHETTKANYHTYIANSQPMFEADVEQQIVWHETYRMLTKAIETLPSQGSRVIQLALEGMTNQKIAHTLGISINTVKLYKKKAYKKLRNELQSTTDDSQHTISIAFLLWMLYL